MTHDPHSSGWPRPATVAEAPLFTSSPQGSISSTKAATPFESGDTAERFAPGQKEGMPFRFGDYLVVREIARGGMGVVYHACDTVLGREIALKMIRSGPQTNPVLIDRFHHEAQAVAALKHPHIVQVFDFGVIGGQHYFTMSLAEGGSLRDHMPHFQRDRRAAVALVAKVARAVEHVHEQSLLHRDLKPANILLDAAGEPLVSDFGLAKSLEVDLELTRTGGAVGTPSYMAPEQAAGRGDLVSPATDVWALGVVLYELLYRRKPFEGDSREEVVRAIREDAPRPPQGVTPAVDRDLAAIVLKCLEKEPADRYASAAALGDDLAAWLCGEPVKARPITRLQRARRWLRHRPLTAAALLILGIGAAATVLAVQRLDPERELRAIHEDLRAGRPVTLIGESGPPRWQRWQIEGAVLSRHPAQPFTLNTGSLCLLELVKDPPLERFELRAEIRQEPSQGHVGFYVGHAADDVGPDKYHSFIVYRFNDWERDPTRQGAATVRAEHYFRPQLGEPSTRGGGLLRDKRFEPRSRGVKQTWRKLSLSVAPDEMIAAWDDEPNGVVDAKTKAVIAHSLVYKARRDYIDRMPDFPPSGGIGLYLDGGVASFRNVVITPK